VSALRVAAFCVFLFLCFSLLRSAPDDTLGASSSSSSSSSSPSPSAGGGLHAPAHMSSQDGNGAAAAGLDGAGQPPLRDPHTHSIHKDIRPRAPGHYPAPRRPGAPAAAPSPSAPPSTRRWAALVGRKALDSSRGDEIPQAAQAEGSEWVDVQEVVRVRLPAPTRVVYPGAPATLEFNPQRLNIHIGEDGKVNDLTFG